MENASKALLMAGGVLITILLLTLFSYIFRTMGASSSRIYDFLEKHEIDEFNEQFLNYKGRENPLSAQDVATIINMAQQANEDPKFPTTITVTINGTAFTNDYKNWLYSYRSLLNADPNNPPKYKCTKVNINSSTGLVDIVEINPFT